MKESTQQTSTLRDKFSLIEPWMHDIIHTVKKDLRQEHLNQDRVFYNKYFRSKTLNKLTTEELVHAYTDAIRNEERGEQIAEFVFHRWLLKHTDIYHFFDKELSKITEDYTTLEQIDRAQGAALKDAAVQKFGPQPTYLFSFLNGVVFDKDTLEELRKAAQADLTEQAKRAGEEKQQHDIEARFRDYEAQLTRLTDRYEGRIAGLERKYERDVTALKKQIASLQRQLQASA